MTKRIFQSICLVALAVFFACGVLILGVLYGYFSDIQQAQLNMQLDLAVQGAELEGISFFRDLPPQACRITWIDSRGKVLFDSRGDSAQMENHLEREEIREALATGQGESRRYSDTLMERSLYTARRLSDGSVLRLSMGQHSAFTLVLGMAQPICAVFLAALALSVFFAIRLSRRIVHPLAQLDLDRPLTQKGYKEIMPLLHRLDSQQRQLKTQKAALEQKQAELEKAERIRREFTANVSHELKTPLQSICGCAELLQNGLAKPEDTPAFAEKMYREARRMVGLVEDIISLSRLDGGASGMQWGAVDLHEIAEQAAASLAAQAQDAGVSVLVTGEPVPMEAIPQLLHSIVYNLCDNAIKYNRPGGKVEVQVEASKQGPLLTVRDTGIGIPQEEQDRVFERFYRVDKSRSKAVGGTGLGLSIVKHAVLIHRGNLNLCSTPGEGTAVTVRFPAAAQGKG